nr:ABC transporter ATP-binding protein [Evansella caseinilytica]
MAEILISCQNISKSYENLLVLEKISQEINSGTFYSISGESGSGKSTLLHLLGLLDTPTAGEIYMHNQAASSMKAKQLLAVRRKTIGFVFQSYHLNHLLTAMENVMLPMYINPEYTSSEMKTGAAELLASVGLEHRKSHLAKDLSGGEKQRVAIARALANDPDCILADEPTGNLDKKNETVIFDIFKKLAAEGKALVVISHNENVVDIADENYRLNNGILEELL